MTMDCSKASLYSIGESVIILYIHHVTIDQTQSSDKQDVKARYIITNTNIFYV